jgi:uncharacterized protein YndB with AHSA1/START domain
MADKPDITGEFDESMRIDAPAAQVFDFVSKVQNLPKYLPTTRQAVPEQGGRVRVRGEAEGHAYDADGYLRADREHLRLEWGADERHYKGNLEVTPRGKQASEVRVHLSFSGGAAAGSRNQGPSPDEVREGIRHALRSIENHVTGRGGKEEPPAGR